MQRPDAVLVGYLGQLDVLLARLCFRRTPVMLDQLTFAGDTAEDRRLPRPVRWLLGALDRIALSACSVAILDTVESRDLISPNNPVATLVIDVGAETRWFSANRAPSTTELGVIFFGLFTPLHGAEAIGSALDLLRDEDNLRFTIVGRGQDFDEAYGLGRSNSHVRWLDWVEPSQLPELVAAHQVCLGIFGTTPKSLRVVPTKVFQGAAAGCVLVTSDTPPQRRALGDAAVFVPPGDPDALADALRTLATDPTLVARKRADASALARARFQPGSVVKPLDAWLRGHDGS
jgi:glycosyltransferase involved in cell wall biosynthesis